MKLSPTTLKSGIDHKWGCKRCFWLKVNQEVRRPGNGLVQIHSQIHDWVYGYLKHNWIPILPAGRLIGTEIYLQSQPIRGVTLHGYLDGLIELADGSGYAIMDIKTTNSPQYASKNYALQVNTYAYCLQTAAQGMPSYRPVQQLGLLTFSGYRFGYNSSDEAGIVGKMVWHPVKINPSMVESAVDGALAILEQTQAPQSNPECEWCHYIQQMTCLE